MSKEWDGDGHAASTDRDEAGYEHGAAELAYAAARALLARGDLLHVPYIRCGSCARIGPHLVTRQEIRFRRTAHGPESLTTPPETVCPICGHSSPRCLNDEVPAGVEVVCRHRAGLRGGWRCCATTHQVPADAALILCPTCGDLTRPSPR